VPHLQRSHKPKDISIFSAGRFYIQRIECARRHVRLWQTDGFLRHGRKLRHTVTQSAAPLVGKKYVCFIEDLYEDLEVWYPKYRLTEAGAKVILAAPENARRYTGKHGYPAVSEAAIRDLTADMFDGVILAGGFSPDRLRRDPQVKTIIADISARGGLVAAICHGGWMAISAGVYRGVKVTGSPGIKDDLVNAGAIFIDAPVVADRHYISSRRPDDLPDFCQSILAFETATLQ
jgi:protease I